MPFGLTSLKSCAALRPGREGIAAHVHQRHVVAGELLAELLPGGDRAGGDDVGQDAVTVEDGAQEAQPVILPLLVRAIGVHQVAQVAQVNPNNLRFLLFSTAKLYASCTSPVKISEAILIDFGRISQFAPPPHPCFPASRSLAPPWRPTV